MNNKSFISDFLIPKIKFAATSLVATGVDYVLYMILVKNVFSPELSQIISASVGMVLNFILQKKFVFLLNRDLRLAFLMSLGFSILGSVGLGTLLVHLLNKMEYLVNHEYNQYIIKFIVTVIIFVYNFYTKRFTFEKKLPLDFLRK